MRVWLRARPGPTSRAEFRSSRIAMLTGDEKRIMILGCGGAGKSTLARELGALLDLPVVHLDREYWRPGWREPPREEWERRVDELIAEPRWILDGNYGGTAARRLAACDTAIHLDLPACVCLANVIRRRLRYRRGASRPDMADGCPEKLDPTFLWWILTFRWRDGRRVHGAIEAARSVRVHVLRTRAEIDGFLRGARSAVTP